MSRADGLAKVTGRATYTCDLKLPGMAHGRILTSTFPHAKLAAIDTTEARALPGLFTLLSTKIMTKVRVFLKLGGSLITNKAVAETAKMEAVERIAAEIALARKEMPDLELLIGHGSGSFGHAVASRYGTHRGVNGADAWLGFAEVALSAAKLNHLIVQALHDQGIPVFRFQPSASARCVAGRLTDMAVQPIAKALEEDLVPLIHGDVAMDDKLGGTIISTEDIFFHLADSLRPQRILLAGDYPGALDKSGKVISVITPNTLKNFEDALAGSEWTDVTGGMAAKVSSMLRLCAATRGLTALIFSGVEPDYIHQALVMDRPPFGTLLSAES